MRKPNENPLSARRLDLKSIRDFLDPLGKALIPESHTDALEGIATTIADRFAEKSK